MPKLNQIVAIVSGQKSEAEKLLTEIYHAFQKADLFTGHTRVYIRKNADDTDSKPPDSKQPQQSVAALYARASTVMTKMIDNVATQDWANCSAKADVKVDGVTVLEAVPVTHLLFLEHKLGDLKAFVDKMPTRDPAEEWHENEESNSFSTDPVRTEVTKKTQVPIVLYDATKEHPAQCQMITKDEVVGYWDTKRFSTAVSSRDKEIMTQRIVKLTEGVKVAREEANSIMADRKEVGAKLLEHIFGGVIG